MMMQMTTPTTATVRGTAAAIAFAFLGLASTTLVEGAGTTSRLQVVFPDTLRAENGYDHREATFGKPPYGGFIEQFLYYSGNTLCDDNPRQALGGYPRREPDPKTGAVEEWKSPFILMVDRGDCHFVNKVRNAQHLGAVAVLIADNVCLCDAGDACSPNDDNADCELNEPLMGDDGSGGDISIPAYLMFKQDADKIKKTLKKDFLVRVNMSWLLPHPDDHVEYEIWTNPNTLFSHSVLPIFADVVPLFQGRAKFTPHLFLFDGATGGCRGVGGDNQCGELCTNQGRYCTTVSNGKMDGVTGAEVVTEGLRQLCIWNVYGEDGIGTHWWEYITRFHDHCGHANRDLSINECSSVAMRDVGIDEARINSCIKDSGGVENDAVNSILERELAAQADVGITMLPTTLVNGSQLRGAVTARTLFEAICAGFAPGTEPAGCLIDKQNNSPSNNDGRTIIPAATSSSSSSSSTVSVSTFFTSLLFLSMGLGAFMYYRMQQTRTEMRSQVQGIMSEYLLLDGDQNNNNGHVETVGFTSGMTSSSSQSMGMTHTNNNGFA